MPVNTKIKLLKKQALKPDIIKYTCLAPEIANKTKPGQFIEIKVSKNIEPFLRRPISIHNVDRENNIIEFIIQVKGKGTALLSELEEGEMIDVIGPLGEGTFDIKQCKNIAIIGGGIGIFPLFELAKRSVRNTNVYIYLGFRNKDLVILEDEFKNVSTNLIVTTDDGTYAKAGYAIDYLEKDLRVLNIDGIFACGPLPLLKKVKELAEKTNIYTQISLEEKMGCGIGVCLGCAVKYKTETEDTFVRVCKEGPIFNAKEVQI
jgi:dihydroorotate dehydrogenase electron transfer subunit